MVKPYIHYHHFHIHHEIWNKMHVQTWIVEWKNKYFQFHLRRLINYYLTSNYGLSEKYVGSSIKTSWKTLELEEGIHCIIGGMVWKDVSPIRDTFVWLEMCF